MTKVRYRFSTTTA